MQSADYGLALDAARRWIAEHGCYPRQQEWERRAPDRPTTRTIKRRWGWEKLMRAAGGRDGLERKAEARKARRLELLGALRRAREELGRWPTAGEWERATADHPARRTYVRWFGSWKAAVEATGEELAPDPQLTPQ